MKRYNNAQRYDKKITERKLRRVIEAVHKKKTNRKAERKYRILKFTVWSRLQCSRADPTHSKRFALTAAEKQLVVDFILRYADRDVPLRRLYV